MDRSGQRPVRMLGVAMIDDRPETAKAVPVWRQPAFRRLVGGQTVGSIGGGIAIFVFPLLAASMTGSVVQASLVGAALPLGQALTGLYGGLAADRYDKLRILRIVAVGMTVVYAGLALAAWTDRLTVPILVTGAFLVGVRHSFFSPAERAAVRRVVAVSDLAQAETMFSARSSAASLVAGPVGGLLLAAHPALPFLVGAVAHVAVLALIAGVRGDFSGAAGTQRVVAGVLDGLRWTVRRPDVRAIIFACAALNFTFVALMFMIVVDLTLADTPRYQIGFLESVGAGLGLVGAIVATRVLPRRRTGPLALTAMGAVCATAIGLALSETLPLYLVLLSVVGLVVPLGNSGLIGFLMARTPDEMQGRVTSALDMIATASMPLAPVVGGALMHGFGYRTAALLVCCMAVAAFVALLLDRTVRRIPRPDQWPDYVATV